MTVVSECEIAGGGINSRIIKPMRVTLMEMNHPQPETPI